MLKRSVLVIIFLLVSLFVYSVSVVYQARVYTEEVILNDYKKREWRVYAGERLPITIKREELTQKQVDWLLAIQDPKFYEHEGIDLSTPGAGLTTISQSIVKKLYFNEFKPGVSKYKQSLIARFIVNKRLNKDEQLEIFINSVYMGNLKGQRIYGFSKSSQVYYGKPVTQLTDDEYLSLVAMLIGPNQFSVLEAPGKNKERVSRIKAVIAGEYHPKELTDVYYNRT